MTVPQAGEPVASEPASGPDLLELLHDHHRAVQELCAALACGSGTPRHRRELVDVVVAELSRHTFLEERFLFPVVRTALADGHRYADRDAAHHGGIEEAVRRLWRLDHHADELGRLGDELTANVRAHVRAAEDQLFPRLRLACPPACLARLGQRAREARELAPTRPHPRAAVSRPWNRLAGPLLGVADQVRDELSGRCTRPDRLTR